MKPGPYLVLPFLGPSTTRDTFSRLVDQFTYPVTYLGDESTRYMIRAVDLLDVRAALLDLDEQIDRSYDRYAFIRNAWLQRREFQVTDGNIEDPSLELEDGAGLRRGAGPRCRTTSRAPAEPPAEPPAQPTEHRGPGWSRRALTPNPAGTPAA